MQLKRCQNYEGLQLNNKIIRLYVCPEVPVEGYIEAKDIAGGNLVAGALYEITGVHPTLYDDGTTSGTTVYLRAISGSELEVQGMGKFYNPKYNQAVDGFGIWDNKMYGTLASTYRDWETDRKSVV